MHLSTQATEQLFLIKVEEERIDAAAALAFKEAVRRLAPHAGPVILLDLSGVTFIDSSGLGALVGLLKALAPAQELRLAGTQAPVQKVLELTRMDQVFVLYHDPAEALEKAGA